MFAANGNKTVGALQMLGDKMQRLCEILHSKDIEAKVEKNPRLARMLSHLWGQLQGTVIDKKLEKAMDSELQKVNIMSASSILMGGEKLIDSFKDLKRHLRPRKMHRGGGAQYFEEEEEDYI